MHRTITRSSPNSITLGNKHDSPLPELPSGASLWATYSTLSGPTLRSTAGKITWPHRSSAKGPRTTWTGAMEYSQKHSKRVRSRDAYRLGPIGCDHED